MKKTKIGLILIMLVAVLASCSLSKEVKEETGDEKTKNLVKVYFDPVTTKSLKTSYGDFEVVYFLTATPNFTRNGRSIITGTTSKQLLGTSGSGSYNAGFFEQGEWTFTLDAVLQKTEGQTTAQSSVIASQTLNNVYISPNNNHVEFTLTDTTFQATDKGDINISVKVPQVAAKTGTSPNFDYGVIMKAFVDGSEVATDFTISEAADVATDGTDLLLFEGSLANIKAGGHVIKLEYYVNKTGGGTELVCAQSIDVYVVPGAPALISGTMLNGQYVAGTISVTYVTNSWTIGFDKTSITTKANQEVTITCTVTGATATNYTWYVNGESVANSNDNKAVFTYTPLTQGVYNIACSAKVGDVTKSTSIYVYADGVAQGN